MHGMTYSIAGALLAATGMAPPAWPIDPFLICIGAVLICYGLSRPN